ncbi:MAG TPA: SIMPL domain-containing protein [Gammaproteobacteria bacterium]|nr:SIMPL domain-containing protein [Gammaproteobacteria bacterium]
MAQPRQPGEETRPTISVSATAQVSAAPDQATVRLGAVAEAGEAADAQQRINAVMQKVLEAVKGLGVPERAIRTDSLSLSPVYSQAQRGDNEPRTPQIIGYRAVDVVTVDLDDLAKIGAVVDAGIQAGANRLQGISFQIRNDSAARAQALAQAVREARADADAVASAMNVRITGVSSVVAGGYSTRPPQPYVAEAFAAKVATPVQPGQVDVSANVSMTYYIEMR